MVVDTIMRKIVTQTLKDAQHESHILTTVGYHRSSDPSVSQQT